MTGDDALELFDAAGLAVPPPPDTWGRGDRYVRRRGNNSVLTTEDFELAARDLRLSLARFAIDTPDKARALFRSR